MVSKASLDVRDIQLDDVPTRYMNPGELEVLVALVKSTFAYPSRMVEFGCNIGRTAKVILREVPSLVSYVGIDVRPGYQYACEVQKNETPQNPGQLVQEDVRFQLLLSERGTFDFTKNDIGKADVVFIDGDHSYDAVRHDSFLAKEIVRSGGIIIWHDYHTIPTVGVRKALEEFHSVDGIDIKYVENTWLAFHYVKGI